MRGQARIIRAGSGKVLAVGLLLAGGLVVSCGEALDDFDSRVVCGDYCSKKADCNGSTPTGDETDICVGSCRNSIEDNCGNDHQAAANDRIGECVDMGCVEFWGCMVFDAAPECYGFVEQ
jgi:hypothetical protein